MNTIQFEDEGVTLHGGASELMTNMIGNMGSSFLILIYPNMDFEYLGGQTQPNLPDCIEVSILINTNICKFYMVRSGVTEGGSTIFQSLSSRGHKDPTKPYKVLQLHCTRSRRYRTGTIDSS